MRLKLPLRGKWGFTLIEIMVVVAILGLLAAIVIPNVINFRNEGLVDAANTEHYNTQLAVLVAMTDQKVSSLADGGDVQPNNADVSVATGNSDDIDEIEMTDFLTGILQAIYTIGTDGHITDATTTGLTNSKWEGLNYTPGSGWSD